LAIITALIFIMLLGDKNEQQHSKQ
jgi:hypothetical protein